MEDMEIILSPPFSVRQERRRFFQSSMTRSARPPMRSICPAISVLLQRDARGVFHVANSDLCTWYTFGQAILKHSGMERVKVIPISSKELGRPAIRPAYSVLNCQKLKKETGLTLRPWSEALKDYLTTHRLTIGRPDSQGR